MVDNVKHTQKSLSCMVAGYTTVRVIPMIFYTKAQNPRVIWGCGLSASAGYMRENTVITYDNCSNNSLSELGG